MRSVHAPGDPPAAIRKDYCADDGPFFSRASVNGRREGRHAVGARSRWSEWRAAKGRPRLQQGRDDMGLSPSSSNRVRRGSAPQPGKG